MPPRPAPASPLAPAPPELPPVPAPIEVAERPLDEELEDPPEELEEPPREPIEVGPHSLLLRAIDFESREPIEIRAELWRVDVPASGGWSAGDVLQAWLTIAKEGSRVQGLPSGRYRIHCGAERRGAPDPSVFSVDGSGEAPLVEVRFPRVREIRLRVLDETWAEIRTGRLRSESSSSSRSDEPRWVQRRRFKRSGCIGIGGGCGFSRRGCWRDVEAGSQGFPLGDADEATRDGVRTVASTLAPAGRRTAVKVSHASDAAGDWDYVAVSVPLERIEALVHLPDGRRAVDAGARIDAWCDAAPGPPGMAASMTIRVRVTFAGFRALEFEYGPRAPPSFHTLELDDAVLGCVK